VRRREDRDRDRRHASATALLDQLVEKADGVPLYLEELTKLVSEQGLIRRGNGRLDPARPGRH
jgi:predicted ATPase